MKILWKVAKYLLIATVFVAALDIAALAFFSLYTPKIKKADAVVVLGAAINTPALYNRSLKGLELYEKGEAGVVVVSGGRISDKDISEAGYMRKVMEANAKSIVPIILEEGSHSTYENLKNTREKIGEGKSIIVVSDRFHIARAVILARRLGFTPVYWDSPNPSYYNDKDLAYYYFREFFAILSYIPKFIKG